MNKKQLIQKVSEKTGMSQKDAAKLLDALIETASDELAEGGSVLLTGFGCLEAKTRKARKGSHPRTGEPIDIPASRTAVFRPGSLLLSKLDNADKQ